jgi:hypothetical protein
MQALNLKTCLGSVSAFNVARAPQNGPKRGQLQVSGAYIKYSDVYGSGFGPMGVAPGAVGRHQRALADSAIGLNLPWRLGHSAADK